jgi:tetratricopeptide (TPR) repeat protein
VNDVLTHADGFRAQFDHLAGTATVVESRDAARYRAALMIETLDGSRRPRRVNQQKSLAVFGVKPAAADENGGFLTYVMRDADFSGPAPDSGTSPGLRDVLRAVGGETGDGEDRRVVLIEGSTAAGKSRSAAEAAIVELATRWLLRPIPGAQALRLIREWPSAELSEALIWLDDVEMYAEPGLGESFRRLLATGAVVIATIRTEQLKVITDTGDLQNPAALALNDPSAVRQLHWNKSWSQTERLAVQEVLETENARQAVADGTPLGVWAVAGLQLSAKYERIQHDDDHPEQKAMVRAILDWYRTGHTGGMPRIILTDLLADGANGYGDATGGFPAREIDVAVEELARPLLGSVREGNALLTRDGSGELLGIHDYIRDADATKVRDIPRSMWLAAAAHASDPNVGHEVAIAARQAGMLDIARAQLETIAQQGDPGAQSNLGVVLHELGDDTSARAWFRKSAEAGDSNGQYNFAVLLENEDEIAEAEAWYRKAAEAGIDSAQYKLGRM